ncbi:PspC domain-containing protein [Herbiconiux sp. CPCC 205763]|uniref:PspC domain-containing protein n=1 Tax=Herbiconiux aconitum TaxID=2970913 RepID=A0ABT2GT15_9MICO|nr:PspC domain-containing protein [Herbiconiux aconitum]MCS5717991.1 PspC domain-containing protein [Herbiconiux aconitum]
MSSSTPPPTPPAPPQPVGASFFAWLRSLGVTRRDDAWVAGVCSGIAARTGLDVRLVRGIAIVIAILGGPIFLAYAVGWALLPDSRGNIHAERAVHGQFTYPMIFIGIAAILTFLPFMRGIWFDGAPHIWGMPDWLEITLRTLWVLALIAGAIWLTVVIARSVPRGPGAGWGGAGSADAGSPFAAPAGYPAAGSANAAAATASAPTAPGSPTSTTAPDAATSPVGSVPDAGAASAEPASGFASASATSVPPADSWSSHAAWTHQGSTDHGWNRERHEQAREASRARTAAWHAAHPRPHGAGAAFSSVVLGIALVAAAVVGIAYGAVVPDGKLVLVISIAALVVIAVGIVIAGIRGRTSGGLGPFAFLLAIVVLFTGVLPAGTDVQPFGTQNIDVSRGVADGADSYLVIAGKSVVDAQDLTTRSPDDTVDVWLGAGQAEVLLPEGVPVVVESHVFAGTVSSTLGTERSGVLIDDDRLFPASGSPAGIPAGSDADRVADAKAAGIPVIRIWMLAGSVTLVPENER